MLDLRGGSHQSENEAAIQSEDLGQPVINHTNVAEWKSDMPPPQKPIIPGINTVRSDDKLVLWIALAAVVITALFGVYASYQKSRAQAQKIALESQIADIKERLASGDLAQARQTVEKVARQIDTLTKSKKDQIAWPVIMTEFKGLVPKAVRLNETSFTANKKLTIKGATTSFSNIAFFIQALKESELFAAPELKSAAFNESVEGSEVNFTLEATYTALAKQALNTARVQREEP